MERNEEEEKKLFLLCIVLKMCEPQMPTLSPNNRIRPKSENQIQKENKTKQNKNNEKTRIVLFLLFGRLVVQWLNVWQLCVFG